MEEFKIIEEFPDYLISNFGRVKTKERPIRYVHAVSGEEHFRKSRERFLKIHLNNITGYKFIHPYLEKKMHNCTIHRLVAKAFVWNPDPELFDTVNHKDGNKHNNIAENLEWCTNAYNHEHATKTGLKARGSDVAGSVLTYQCVSAIRKMLADRIPHSTIARWFGVSSSAISMINTGATWNFALVGDELNVRL